MATERIHLADGNWWDVHTQMTWGARRAIRKIMSKYMPDESIDKVVAGGEGSETLNAADFQKEVSIKGAMEMQDETELARLMHCSVVWSWKDPISETSIDSRSEVDVIMVLRRMSELYDSQHVETEEVAKEEKKVS